MAEAAMTAKMKLPPDQPKDKPKRRPLPDQIPRNDIEFSPPKDHCTCGGALRQIGEDVTEELEYVPGRFVVNKITRPRFSCKRCEQFSQVILPSRPIERTRQGSTCKLP
ncbi:MAG: IS66 family transposase zinc-finger binding domain-containing protein [Paracoccaceae bacterium]